MPNRSKKRWLDIQLILASIAVTSTVALWNNFARGARAAEVPAAPPPPDPTFTLSYTPTPTATATAVPTATVSAITDSNGVVHLPKVHLLLGGKLPVIPVVVAVQPSSSGSSNQSGGSKSSGGSTKTTASNPAPAPAPVTNTSSSKP